MSKMSFFEKPLPYYKNCKVGFLREKKLTFYPKNEIFRDGDKETS